MSYLRKIENLVEGDHKFGGGYAGFSRKEDLKKLDSIFKKHGYKTTGERAPIGATYEKGPVVVKVYAVFTSGPTAILKSNTGKSVRVYKMSKEGDSKLNEEGIVKFIKMLEGERKVSAMAKSVDLPNTIKPTLLKKKKYSGGDETFFEITDKKLKDTLEDAVIGIGYDPEEGAWFVADNSEGGPYRGSDPIRKEKTQLYKLLKSPKNNWAEIEKLVLAANKKLAKHLEE